MTILFIIQELFIEIPIKIDVSKKKNQHFKKYTGLTLYR